MSVGINTIHVYMCLIMTKSPTCRVPNSDSTAEFPVQAALCPLPPRPFKFTLPKGMPEGVSKARSSRVPKSAALSTNT
jgi:hypothetical protein